MARRKKRKAGRFFAGLLITLCILSGLGIVIKKQFPDILSFTKEAVETVKMKTGVIKSVPFQEVKIPEGDVSTGYYYQQLSPEEQVLYKEMYQGILGLSESIYVHSADVDLLSKINQFIYCDRPEIFWGTGEMQIQSYEDYSEVFVKYTIAREEKDSRQAQIDEQVQVCLSGVTAEMTEYDKIKYVYEYIVNTVDYNLDAPDNQNIYSIFVGKSSVCAGYSRATQYLLQKMGIECLYVTGNIPGQGAHAWNIVKCDGQYFQVDVTFGDPVFLEAEGAAMMPEQSINYDYLCCSDAEILKNHTMDTLVSFPACTSMDLNYYKLNGMYYEEFQPEQMLQNMNQSIYSQSASFTCKFANDALYQEAREVVINDLAQRAAQNLLDYYGLESVQYNYVEEETMNRITIYWNYQ